MRQALRVLSWVLLVYIAAWIITKLLSNYHVGVLVLTLLLAYRSVCWNMIGGLGGQVSVGHALFVGAGAYVSTILYLKIGLSPWIGMLLGGLVGSALGFSMGYLTFRFRIKGHFFAIASIAFAEVFRIIVVNLDYLGGNQGLTIPIKGSSFAQFQFQEKSVYLLIVLTMLMISVFVFEVIRRGKIGYYIMAIRDDEDAASSLGVNTMRTKLIILMVSGCLTSWSGTFYAQYVLYIDPYSVMGIFLSVDVIMPAILGGVGTTFGPILGSFILLPIAEIMRALLGSSFEGGHLFFYGLIMVLVMMFVQEGIIGTIFKKR